MSKMSSASSKMHNPKLLFLAWNFPPNRAVASVRTWNIAKHLSRLSWNVTVVTPKSAVWRQLDDRERAEERIATEGIRRILTEHRLRFLSPIHLNCRDSGVGWILGGISSALKSCNS